MNVIEFPQHQVDLLLVDEATNAIVECTNSKAAFNMVRENLEELGIIPRQQKDT